MKVTSATFVKGIRGTDPIVTDGVSQIAFVGRSNVGKSSLINALTGQKNLVKVSDKPGKTTEINFFRAHVQGNRHCEGAHSEGLIQRSNPEHGHGVSSALQDPGLLRRLRSTTAPRNDGNIYLVDLPGYGYAKVSPKEKEKLRKLIIWYLTESGARPETIVLIVDMKVGVTEFDRQMIDVLRAEGHSFVIVANKYDKLTQKERSQQLARITAAAQTTDVIPCSTRAPGGIRAVAERLFH